LNGSNDDTELWPCEVIGAFESGVSSDGLLDLVLGLLDQLFAVREYQGSTIGAICYVSKDNGFAAACGDHDQALLIVLPRLEHLTNALFLILSELHSVSLRFVVRIRC
jgi:hypothetical protein